MDGVELMQIFDLSIEEGFAICVVIARLNHIGLSCCKFAICHFLEHDIFGFWVLTKNCVEVCFGVCIKLRCKGKSDNAKAFLRREIIEESIFQDAINRTFFDGLERE